MVDQVRLERVGGRVKTLAERLRRVDEWRVLRPTAWGLPVALWELSLGVYLVVKGFKPSPITDAMVAAGAHPA